ncbi:MAG: pseudouridine synthase [Pseudomonadota bacterium]
MPPKSTPAKPTPAGERIAKVLSRRGVASRREAERMIELGEVSVNGKVITSPALNVTDADRITVRGEAMPDEEAARLWLYYKPEGLVTSASDEKGRQTVFDTLPEDLPRVMSVGRLDLNSEGLLLLTNDGELKRRLELPSTGWLRKYRVRVKGNPTDPDLEPLRQGIIVDGERFQPMIVSLDRHQGANAWLTVGLREGKNREIRRAINAIGLIVNRLIRVSYGPFRLGEMQPGQVEEVRPKVLRDQLGETAAPDDAKPARRPGQKITRPSGKPAAATPGRRDPDIGGRDGAEPARRRLKPAEGMKSLSDAWQQALSPKEVAAERARGTAARPAAPRPPRSTKPAPDVGGPPRKSPPKR